MTDPWGDLLDDWDDFMAKGHEMSPATYLYDLAGLAARAEKLREELSSERCNWEQETLMSRVITVRYAAALVAIARGYDPRRCPHCGSAHPDAGFYEEPVCDQYVTD